MNSIQDRLISEVEDSLRILRDYLNMQSFCDLEWMNDEIGIIFSHLERLREAERGV